MEETKEPPTNIQIAGATEPAEMSIHNFNLEDVHTEKTTHDQ